jgi:DNA polymerase elongation subunit (family B)
VKREDATRDDYADLASAISEATGLPMRLDSHFRYLVLLTKTTDPSVIVANRYYGKLTDGSLFYRGIELRRHDTPPYINEMQREMMMAMFSHGDASQVESRGVPEAQRIAKEALRRLTLGRVDPHELVISKRLRRDLKEYKARQPHVVAAMLGADKDMAEYILLNVENMNPFTRVMPASLVDSGHRSYDRKKYTALARRAAWNLLRPFVRDEKRIGGSRLRERRLDTYF